MIRPSKHSHPDRTVINASMFLLMRLKSKRLDSFDALRTYLRKGISGGDFLFLPALNLLFVLGLIEYHQKADSFEYVGHNEAV